MVNKLTETSNPMAWKVVKLKQVTVFYHNKVLCSRSFYFSLLDLLQILYEILPINHNFQLVQEKTHPQNLDAVSPSHGPAWTPAKMSLPATKWGINQLSDAAALTHARAHDTRATSVRATRQPHATFQEIILYVTRCSSPSVFSRLVFIYCLRNDNYSL